MAKEESKIPRGPYCYKIDIDQAVNVEGLNEENTPLIICPYWKWIEDGYTSFATCTFLYNEDQCEKERVDGDTINTILLDAKCKVCTINLSFNKEDEYSWKLLDKLKRNKNV